MTNLQPASWFSSPPGEDGVIVARDNIRRWLTALAGYHSTVHLRTFGTSTEGNPLDALFVGDALAHGDPDELATQRRRSLAELQDDAGTAWSTPVVLITSGIHATEIGGPQSIPELVYWLVTSAEASVVRERVLTIIIPTLNPDGMDLVKPWHERTAGTDRQGSLPPLLYHRFAGHDNNRDWLFRNLAETRQVLDAIHDTWWPHVTLDQHQMNPHGPRFALPPYTDPWEPNVHPSLIAAGASLGQAIATELTLDGKTGVMTGRHFDAWEPSRAIQHYRGGIRILAEAASANLAWPMDVSADQLAGAPLPMATGPAASFPAPWSPGTWRLRDIMDYHLAAAKSLLTHVSHNPDRWPAIQRDALAPPLSPAITFRIPFDPAMPDPAANRRLASMLEHAGARSDHHHGSQSASFPVQQPMGRLLNAALAPEPYPAEHGKQSYDLTTHQVPLFLGASLRASAAAHDGADPAGHSVSATHGPYVAVDARCHTAPNLIETARASGASGLWRTTRNAFVDDALVENGTWVIADPDGRLPLEAGHQSGRRLAHLPQGSQPVTRRDIVLLTITDAPTADHGWTRLWLQERRIPILETEITQVARLSIDAERTTCIIAHVEPDHIDTTAITSVANLLESGANVIAFGGAGRRLASALSPDVTSFDAGSSDSMHAPGALLRLIPDRRLAMGRGLDRVIPAMFQRDGVFGVAPNTNGVHVLSRFATRDTLLSGWMEGSGAVRNKPAIVQVRHGAGNLYAFAFRPLFRGQMLVTAPLVHNVLYAEPESPPCPPSDRGKTPENNTSVPTS